MDSIMDLWSTQIYGAGPGESSCRSEATRVGVDSRFIKNIATPLPKLGFLTVWRLVLVVFDSLQLVFRKAIYLSFWRVVFGGCVF